MTSTGASVNLILKLTKTIGRTSTTVVSHAAQVQHAGTDVALSTVTLSRSPAAGSTSGVLLQVPGAARGANGAVHVNGDHGDINYVVDGVALPQALNRVIGNEVDASNVAFAEVLEGAYPAQYGERFGAVLNLASRGGTPGPRGVTFDATGGAFARYEATLGYHAPVGRGGSLLVASRTGRDGRALDPASENAPHDAGSDANQFLRLTLPYGKGSFANFTLSHSLQTYQIPPDVAAGAPAAQDDNETQDDVFASLQISPRHRRPRYVLVRPVDQTLAHSRPSGSGERLRRRSWRPAGPPIAAPTSRPVRSRCSRTARRSTTASTRTTICAARRTKFGRAPSTT